MTVRQEGFVFRRGELLAELFLQDLRPMFVAKPTGADYGIDFFVGFKNAKGGVNLVMVEVKATEALADSRYRLKTDHFVRLANGNVPGLILVVDVKLRRYFYCIADPSSAKSTGQFVSFAVVEADETNRNELIRQLST